ncbi:MAG: hypothetical protein LBT89_09500 [Planctomycetaceae bacterium]|jgi:flagellin|nr:hypothetical protein [Planctomycetaceae bacterium]
MQVNSVSLYSVNLPELQALIEFNRMSLKIAGIVQRLETGERINSGKDDPAGLIIRDIMRRDIRGIQAAQKNTSAANELLTTADSAMANIADLLIGDINDPSNNGLIGLIWDDSVPTAMKQEQINNILNMVNVIAGTTTYGSKRLLDGSLAYQTRGVNTAAVSQLHITQANFSTPQTLPVTVKVIEKAQGAALTLNQGVIGSSGGTLNIQGTAFNFTAGMSAADIVNQVNAQSAATGVSAKAEDGLTNNQFVLASSSGDNGDLVFTVKDGVSGDYGLMVAADSGLASGEIEIVQSGSDFVILYGSNGTSAPTADEMKRWLNYGSTNVQGTVADIDNFRNTFQVDTAAGQNGSGQISGGTALGTLGDANSGTGLQFTGYYTPGGVTGIANKVALLNYGTANNTLLAEFGSGGTLGGSEANTLYVRLATDAQGNVTTTADDLAAYLKTLSQADTGYIGVSVVKPAGQSYTDSAAANTASGYGTLSAGTVNLDISVTQRVDATTTGTTKIVFETLDTGSQKTLEITDPTGHYLITDSEGQTASTAAGKDIIATVNGQRATAQGRNISYSSDSLTFSALLSDTMNVGDVTKFEITGGGALFQLGRDVTDVNQFHTAIESVRTTHLGGSSGLLEDLRTMDLSTLAGKERAYNIVNEAVKQIALQRGRLGAVQKSVIETSGKKLDSDLESVSEAEGLISNIDTALETSRLNQAELLAQSAMSAILYARAFAQSVFSLINVR